MRRIDKILRLTVGTTAQDVSIGWGGFMLRNDSDTAMVYIKEKRTDGLAVTAATGYAVGPGETLDGVFTADVLSVIASAASTAVGIMLIREG